MKIDIDKDGNGDTDIAVGIIHCTSRLSLAYW